MQAGGGGVQSGLLLLACMPCFHPHPPQARCTLGWERRCMQRFSPNPCPGCKSCSPLHPGREASHLHPPFLPVSELTQCQGRCGAAPKENPGLGDAAQLWVARQATSAHGCMTGSPSPGGSGGGWRGVRLPSSWGSTDEARRGCLHSRDRGLPPPLLLPPSPLPASASLGREGAAEDAFVCATRPGRERGGGLRELLAPHALHPWMPPPPPPPPVLPSFAPREASPHPGKTHPPAPAGQLKPRKRTEDAPRRMPSRFPTWVPTEGRDWLTVRAETFLSQ